MSIFRICFSACLAATAFTALKAESHCPGNVASIPLHLVGSVLFVAKVQITGHGPFDFLVDTGAQITTVDRSLAEQLGLTSDGTTGVSGVASHGRKSFAHLDTVEIEGHSINHVLAVIDNLGQLQAADAKIRGILGLDFLAHFDLLIDYEHHILCMDAAGILAKAIKGTRIPLAQPYGPDPDLPFTRPLVVKAKLQGSGETRLFRLDSGSNAPLIYRTSAPANSVPGDSQILSRMVEGVEQRFAVVSPQDVLLGGERISQVRFIEPLNAIGPEQQPREDGLLPTAMFKRAFVSYQSQFAVLQPR